MVASLNHIEFFEKSKKFFEAEDIINSLENYKKVMEHFGRSDIKNKDEYIQFLLTVLKHCEENKKPELEAMALRALGRTYSFFKQHAESMKYHYKSLKIQKKLGRKKETAEGLVFLAEDLEVSGNFDKIIAAFQEASNIFQELGKLKKVEEIKNQISRLQEFSKEIVEDEYFMNKFHVDNY